MFNLNNGNITKETAGWRVGDPGRRVTGPGSCRKPHAAAGGAAAQPVKIGPPQEESCGGPKQGGPSKVMPSDPKEMRSDAWVHNFECAIISYFKGAHVSNHLKWELFFDSLSNLKNLYNSLFKSHLEYGLIC